ncbi:MAG: hypothetical protein V4466_09440, partial [Pseudomonadota bacterium]
PTTGNPASDEISSPAVDTRINPPPVETVGTPPPPQAEAMTSPPVTAAPPTEIPHPGPASRPPR